MFLNKELKLNHLVYFICFQIIGAITAFILMNYMQKD
jgi:glycerol uptake facilitator-like aquaporin